MASLRPRTESAAQKHAHVTNLPATKKSVLSKRIQDIFLFFGPGPPMGTHPFLQDTRPRLERRLPTGDCSTKKGLFWGVLCGFRHEEKENVLKKNIRKKEKRTLPNSAFPRSRIRKTKWGHFPHGPGKQTPTRTGYQRESLEVKKPVIAEKRLGGAFVAWNSRRSHCGATGERRPQKKG